MEENKFLIEFGQRVKSRRLQLGLSQEDLSKRCDYAARSSINRIEQGKLDLPQSKIMQLSNALQTTPAWLMGWSESDYVPPQKEEEYDLTALEKKVITEFRAADTITRGMVLRALSLDEEEEKRNSKGNSA